jgi:chaperonin GroES
MSDPAAAAEQPGDDRSDASPEPTAAPTNVKPLPRSVRGGDDVRLPVKMLNDRVLVRIQSDGERRSSGGILIPATAQQTRRLAWAEVVAVGPNVRSMEPGDQVLFDPEDRYEVEVRGEDYIILRERDLHAVAASRIDDPNPGLYL